MFGKKSSSGGKSKPKKSVKQGPKVNFFAAHAEKLVLGLVVGLLSFLVYEGFGGKTYDQSRQPNQLAEKATSISNNIRNGDPWPVLKEKVPAEHSFTPKTEAARQPTDEKIYGAFPMGGAGGQPFVKRGDPTLMPPTKIVGQSVVGLIAVEAADDYVDPFEDFEDAVKLKGKASGGSSGKPNRNQKGSEGSMGGYGDMASGGSVGSGGGMADMGGYGQGGGNKRHFPSKYNRGFTLGGAAGGMGMGSGSGMGEMAMGSMGDMASGGSAGSMASPMGGAVGGAVGGGLNGAARPRPKKYKAEVLIFNAVTALVPHEDLIKEYDAKLRESASFNAMRDKPIYLNFEYQRCEVNAGQPDKWDDKPLGSAREQLAMMKKWLPTKPQTIPEVIDMASYDRALTMPIPPLLMQDYRKFAKHPDIDWIWDAGMNQVQVQAPVNDGNQTDNNEQLLPGERPGGMGGMGSGSGMMGGSMGSMGGYGDMASGGSAGGMDPSMGMAGSMGGYGDMASGGSAGGMDSGMMGGSMGGYGGSGSMGGYGMGGSMAFMPAKYKMIRFYDPLKPSDIGKTFKYRVRVTMEDPNYPSDTLAQAPPANDLEPQVFERVSAARAIDDPIVEKYRLENVKARQVALANKTAPKLKFHTRKKRDTDWSEPSKGIYVRGYDDVYVNKMGKKQANPEVDAVIVRLDIKKGAYVPMYFFVEDEEALKKQAEEKDKDAKPPKIAKVTVPPFRRGAVVALGTPLTTQFAHPITNVIKRWAGYEEFSKGWNTVVDVRGGEPLAGNKAQEDPLTDNVEMMMLMSDGRVEVSSEFDDVPQYRGFTFADEREAAEKGTGSAAGGTAGYGMDGSGGGPGGKR